MGLQESKVASCLYCGVGTNSANWSKRHQTYLCVRCGGPVPYQDNEPAILPLKTLHVVPLRETLPDWIDESEDLDREGMEQKEGQVSGEYLFENYVRPCLLQYKDHPEEIFKVGDRFQYKDVDFKIIAACPFSGRIDTSTVIFVDESVSCLETIERATIYPIRSSLEHTEIKDIVEDIIQPYFRHEIRHLVEGEVIFYKGVQLKVINCQPKSGLVDETTTLFTDGEDLEDLKRVHILPVRETLPSDEIPSEEEIFIQYMQPFFMGTLRYIKLGDQINIRGVDFHVVAAEPRAGIFTNETELFNSGEPLSQIQLDDARLRADEDMARRIQMQMLQEQFGPPQISQQQLDQTRFILRARVQGLISALPDDHPSRQELIGIDQRLAQDHTGMEIRQFMLAMQRDAGFHQGSMRPANNSQIEQLPSYAFDSSRVGSEASTETLTCRVCLCEYDDGEMLRTLPCFHRFHKDCIDRWLVRDGKCPICKHNVVE